MDSRLERALRGGWTWPVCHHRPCRPGGRGKLVGRYGFHRRIFLKFRKCLSFKLGGALEERFALSNSVGKEALTKRRFGGPIPHI